MLRNEKGYALVIVLLIITVTFTFALSMSGMALSARKQFNKTDETNKATDLAEMGVAHYETLLANIVKASNIAAENAVQQATQGNNNGKKNRNIPIYDDHFFVNFKTFINQVNNKYIFQNVEGSNSYKVTLISLSEIQMDKTILVKFKSEGISADGTKTLTSTIKVEKNGISRVGENVPISSEFEFIEENELNHSGNHLLPYKSTYFKKKILLKGTNKIIISGNAFFKDKVELRGTDQIIVNGDAIFYSSVDNPIIIGNSSLCVNGNIYVVDQSTSKLIEYTNFYPGKKSCPRPLDDEWYINPDDGITVQY